MIMRQDKKALQSQLTKKQPSTKLKSLKVAIVHDSYFYLGGAERVLNSILQLFPQAEIYIPLIKDSYRLKLAERHRVYTSFLNAILLPEKLTSILKPLVIFYWEKLNLNTYDLVISSSHSFSSKSVRPGKNTLYIAYLHTTPRYLYSEFNEMNWLKKPLYQKILARLLNYLRTKDFQAAQRPEILIANSKTTQARIKKYYRRSSQVIYPPVKLPQKIPTLPATKTKYYVFHSRLVKQKGGELIIRTFNKLKKPLIVVGTGPEEKKLRQLAGKHISFRGFIPEHKMTGIYAKAKALIFAAIEEDFGLIPVEAMSHGVPVIGYDSGGVRETVVNHKTGLLFHDYSLESLGRAVNSFEKRNWSANACRKQASKFAENKFQRKFLKIIHTQLLKHQKSHSHHL